MPIVERRVSMVGAIVAETSGRGAGLRPGVDPGLAILLGVPSALHLRVDEPRMRPARSALLCVVLVDWLLAGCKVLVEDEEVIARQALGRVLAQFSFGDER